MSNPILDFLENRKQTKLKKPGNKTSQEIEEEFEIASWVKNAADRAGQLRIVSHPGKFSHPDAKITPLLYNGSPVPDGYLRSGNVSVAFDVEGNAAALDVYGFLAIKLEDEKTVLEHVENRSSQLREILGVSEEAYDQICQGLLKIKVTYTASITHSNVKQVYFPVEDGYHLLSILTPSGIVTKNLEMIREMKFSEEAKSAREARKLSKYHEVGLNDINFLILRFGGTQPQNISRLNSGNSGEAWLLPSLPPSFAPKYVRVPKRDFFQSLFLDDSIKMTFQALHRMFTTEYNNVNIRQGRKKCFESIFDWVFERASFYQRHSPGWSDDESVKLPLAQRLWLDSHHFENRKNHPDWQDDIIKSFATWTTVTYRRLRKRTGDAVTLGATEETAFMDELRDYSRRVGEDLV